MRNQKGSQKAEDDESRKKAEEEGTRKTLSFCFWIISSMALVCR